MDRRQAMLSAVAAPLALLPLPLLANKPKRKWKHTCGGRAPVITIHIVYPYHDEFSRKMAAFFHTRTPDPAWGITGFPHVILGLYVRDSFISWKRNGRESDKTLVILKGDYTAEKMAKDLNMQCHPVHDCIKFVVRDGKCVPIAT